jgi:hypothetical protein
VLIWASGQNIGSLTSIDYATTVEMPVGDRAEPKGRQAVRTDAVSVLCTVP